MRIFPNIYRAPFSKSQLKLFVGRAIATKASGGSVFKFDGMPTNFLVNQTLVSQAIYFFWEFNFTVDTAEADYTDAIAEVPLLSLNYSSQPSQPILRQPFPVPLFFQNNIIYQGVENLIQPNFLQFSMTGSINQTAALTNKTQITATVSFTAHEITDTSYIEQFKNGTDVMPPPRPGAHGKLTAAEKARQSIQSEVSRNPSVNVGEGLSLPTR